MSAVTQQTEESILAFVSAVKKKEGPEPNPSVYLALLDQCLAEAFRETKAFDTYWDNTADGDLDLDSSNVTALPHTCLIIERVEWDGSDSPLRIVTLATLDYEEPGWRDQTGEPGKCVITGRRLFLNTTPSSATGKLVARGYGVPPRNDALAYFPADVQLAPAKFILKGLPWDPEIPKEVARYQQYRDEWEGTPQRVGDRARMLSALRDRTMEDFDF